MAREIVLDTETTGFDPNTGDRLVEVACLEVVDFVPTGRSFHRYIDPCRDMPAGAEKVHGLSTAFLRGKPKFEPMREQPYAYRHALRAGTCQSPPDASVRGSAGDHSVPARRSREPKARCHLGDE